MGLPTSNAGGFYGSPGYWQAMGYAPDGTPPRYLPGQTWNPSAPSMWREVSAEALNRVAVPAAPAQLTVAAQNAPLRLLYGRVPVGAQVANVLAYNLGWVIQCVWGEGEIEGVEQSFANDIDIAAIPGALAYHYAGTAGQSVNALMVAAFAAQAPAVAYADALPNIAYSVYYLPAGAVPGFPRIAAIVKGLKVYDPRGATTAWSDNPSLALADFESHARYGKGRAVNWTSVGTAADADDELVSGAKRRTLGLAIDTPQMVDAWSDALRTYAGCWVIDEGGERKLVPDRPRATDATYSHSAGQIHRIGALKLRGIAQVPTAIELRYTDTSQWPWRDASVWVYAAGVLEGTTPRRDSQVALPGIQSASQALREATERLNKLTLGDLSFSLEVFDIGLKHEVGDVIEVTHPIGLAAKKMRIVPPITGEYGRFALALQEYDPAFYSDAVKSETSYPNTNLPNPADPPALAGLVLTEEVYTQRDGTSSSRIRASWSAPSLPYLFSYQVEVWDGATLVTIGSASVASYATPKVQEGRTYTVKVRVLSSTGSPGPWVSDSRLALGKGLAPGNVPSVRAFEAGGRVYIQWDPAVDIDVWRYRLRYAAVGGAWAAGVDIDLVDALTKQTDTIPVGTWDIMVRAVDSVRQESPAEARCTVAVSSDAASFLVDSFESTSPGLTNMAQYHLGPADTRQRWISEDGVAWDDKFTSNLDSYTNPLATYHGAMTSTWLGEAEDFGSVLSGNWSGEAAVADVSGTHKSYLGFSQDGGDYAYLEGLSQKQNARFVRLKHEALGSATLYVEQPSQTVRLAATPRVETGKITTSASGPTPVVLEHSYTAVQSINLQPLGTVSRQAVVDNVQVGDNHYVQAGYVESGYVGAQPNGFDVYAFTLAGAQVANDIYYEFRGL